MCLRAEYAFQLLTFESFENDDRLPTDFFSIVLWHLPISAVLSFVMVARLVYILFGTNNSHVIHVLIKAHTILKYIIYRKHVYTFTDV